MAGVREETRHDAVLGHHDTSGVDAFASEERRVVKALAPGVRPFEARVERAVAQNKNPSFGPGVQATPLLLERAVVPLEKKGRVRSLRKLPGWTRRLHVVERVGRRRVTLVGGGVSVGAELRVEALVHRLQRVFPAIRVRRAVPHDLALQLFARRRRQRERRILDVQPVKERRSLVFLLAEPFVVVAPEILRVAVPRVFHFQPTPFVQADAHETAARQRRKRLALVRRRAT
mmetsp:Transcript_19304/g.59562  ORF Transcript_19304/g.59562 Transcript_19304/m.59562 type:complete len:231 (+) Transcript_19304:549-1241(+)